VDDDRLLALAATIKGFLSDCDHEPGIAAALNLVLAEAERSAERRCQEIDVLNEQLGQS
jgi:hypothetical protein